MFTYLRRSSICIGLLILLIPILVFPQDVDVSPCARAKYDVEHNIQRTHDMVVTMYNGDLTQVEEYTKCYEELTGFDIKRGRSSQFSKKDTVVLIVLLVITLAVVQLTLKMDTQSSGLNFSG